MDTAEKMRSDWNDRAQRGYMRYTSGTETDSEKDYAESARRDRLQEPWNGPRRKRRNGASIFSSPVSPSSHF